jgi:hypothetical protein
MVCCVTTRPTPTTFHFDLMKAFTCLTAAVIVTALGALHCAKATSVIAPTFNELVDEADAIFQGSVTSVKSQWVGEGAQRHITTYVTFKVDQTIKGNVGETYTLRMLGGTVDGESMEVSDAPKFEVGNKDILFVQNNGTQFVPLVGIMHGRFRIRSDASGREVVTRNNGESVSDLARLGVRSGAEQNKPAVTPDEFKAAITERLRQTQHPAP